MKYIFSLTTLIAMFICFFSLMSSMFTNVYEQTKEIGVLRALGTRLSFVPNFTLSPPLLDSSA
jgi:ABC-type antimicrobial peptide transport system permease subunit